jgi:hypothetical protein
LENLMTAPSPAEVRNVSAARVNAAQDLDQIMASLPPAVDMSSIEQLKAIAEHLAELAEMLQPAA